MLAYRAVMMAAIVLCQLLAAAPTWAQAWAQAGAQAGRADVDDRLRMLTAGLALADDADALGRDVEAFYATRGFHAAWQDAQTVSAFAAALYTLADDGLEPGDYGAGTLVAAYRELEESGADGASRARFDIAATRTYLTVLRHLNRGKVDPKAIDPEWDVALEPFALDMAAASRAVDTLKFDAAFALARPSYSPYERLRAGLARYRAIGRAGGWPTLPARDEALRPGARSPDVAILRQRLAAVGEAAADAAQPDVYDAALVAAVKRFQRNQYLAADGVVGVQTRAALNVSVGARIDQIRINLERARWLLHGLPESYVLVDIAGYQLSYYRPDGSIWRSRIVVGQPYRKTPSLRSKITYLTFNPTWTVPPTVLRQDILPRVRRDPGYLASKHIRVLTPEGQEIDPATVDWQRPTGVILRQDPGPDNSLGRVIVRFPNPYMVYLHDTPAPELFQREQRAFSSGCIRVEDVREFARLLLDDPVRWRAEDIDRIIAGGRTQNATLRTPVPVIVHYWTVNVGEDGTLAFKPDIYHRDRALLAALDRPPRG